MKISLSILAVGLISTAAAFGPIGSVSSSKSPRGPLARGSEPPTEDEPQAPAPPEPLFPTVMPMETLQGYKTVRTCEFVALRVWRMIYVISGTSDCWHIFSLFGTEIGLDALMA